MNTLKEQIESSREAYGIILSSIDSMTQKKEETDSNISTLFNQIFGSIDSGNKGILYFWSKLVQIAQIAYPGTKFMNSTSALTVSQFKEQILGTLSYEENSYGLYEGGMGSSAFGDDETRFDIDLTDSIFLDSGFSLGDSLVSDSFETRATAIRTSVLTASSSGYYSFTSADQQAIDSLTEEIKGWINTTVPGAAADIASLADEFVAHMNQVMQSNETAEFWGIPDLSGIQQELNSMSNLSKDWVTELDTANEALQDPSLVYTSSSSVSSDVRTGLNSWVDSISSGLNSYNSYLSSLGVLVQNIMFLGASTSSEVQGLRRHWVYWILQCIDRPRSYRMDWNGCNTALSSLEEQRTSSRVSVSLVTSNYEYLPTPVLNCVYLDPDTNEAVAVFTSLPCFDFIDLNIGGTVSTITKENVINNSEIRLTQSLSSGTEVSLRLRRNPYLRETEVSEYSEVFVYTTES